MFDLVLKGGTLLDPGQGLSGSADVGVRDGVVSEVGPQVDERGADRTLDVEGCIVTPGLIDIHAHVYHGGTSVGARPDDICPPSGVTTVVDGGSSGSDNFAGFRDAVARLADTRTLSFVNLSRIGLVGLEAGGELMNSAYADPEGTKRVLTEHPELGVGIKLRLSRQVMGGPCLPPLEQAINVSREIGKPLHLHIGDSVESMTEILPRLSSGDMVTHYQTPKPNGLLGDDGNVLAAALDAKSRGVLFDCGHGRTHFSFDVAAALIEGGLPPDTISSDLSLRSYPDLAPGLLTVMNKWLALGLSIDEVISATTWRAAGALQKQDSLGSLRVGNAADVAVFASEEGEFGYSDALGQTRTITRRLTPKLTLRGGRVVWMREAH